jgi:hypothetical protein
MVVVAGNAVGSKYVTDLKKIVMTITMRYYLYIIHMAILEHA